jgi:hypothetical protein
MRHRIPGTSSDWDLIADYMYKAIITIEAKGDTTDWNIGADVIFNYKFQSSKSLR